MAEKKDSTSSAKKSSKPALSKKKSMSVRERAASAQASSQKPKRIRSAAGKAGKPLSRVKNLAKKEVHPITLPDNKAGRILKKRVRFMPKFFIEAFREIRQVTWPNRRSTISLTFAVFIFAVIFASFVGGLDFFLGEAFERLFVN